MSHAGPREFNINGVAIDLKRVLKGDNQELEEVFADILRQLEDQRMDTERAFTDTDEVKTDSMRVWFGA